MTEQSGIVRRPDFAGGGITEEERGRIAAHSALWLRRALRTEPADPHVIEAAVKGIYGAASLAEPRVIIAQSPLVMAMAGGIASLWWYLFENNLLGGKSKRNGENYDAAIAATIRATNTATREATYGATFNATAKAIDRATRAAASPALHSATYDATDDVSYDSGYTSSGDATIRATCNAIAAAARDATTAMIGDATRDAIYCATDAATKAATGGASTNWLDIAAEFVGPEWAQAALRTATLRVWITQGGNAWAFSECHLTAARDILGLRLAPHTNYAYWEQATINGGRRWMHPKFCLVSDFPKTLRVNSRHQPHAEFGPSHKWRDGWSLWHLNGVNVERWMTEWRPDDMDARRLLQIENADQRGECIRRMGVERFLAQLDSTVLDAELWGDDEEYSLLAIEMNHGEPWRFLQSVNQSSGAVRFDAVPRECHTVEQAWSWQSQEYYEGGKEHDYLGELRREVMD